MTKKRRYLISAGLLAACVGLALGVLAMLPPRPGVTKANFDRIKNGMTLTELEAIFGGEPNQFVFSSKGTCIGRGWIGPDEAYVYLTVSNESVTEKQWFVSTETFAERLRRWLHLAK